MTAKFLPTLKTLRIKNYSLYPNAEGLEIRYNFVEGINLIIGGNGVGKTTFLNILKYALLGLYKKEIDVKRRAVKGKEYRSDKRTNLPYDYFRNRTDDAADYNETAEVTLTFSLGKKSIEVTRNLFEPKIVSAKTVVGEKATTLTGSVIKQKDYDLLFNDNETLEVAEKTLQGQYEKIVGEFSGFEYFDNLIFIVNEVLFFNESRKTIMWDSKIQHNLSSKFLIDPEKDREKEELERNGKYFNSLSRHKSEEGKAIRRMLDSFDGTQDNSVEYKTLMEAIEAQKDTIASIFNSIETTHKDRNVLQYKINACYSDKNKTIKIIDVLNSEKIVEERNLYADAFEQLTPKYHEYYEFLKTSADCPLCNQQMGGELHTKLISHPHNCIFCNAVIRESGQAHTDIDAIDKKLEDLHQLLHNKEKEILALESDLKELDKTFSDLSVKQNKAAVTLREYEFKFQKYQSEDTDAGETELKIMTSRLDELNKEKEENLKKSKTAYDRARIIGLEIDEQLTSRRIELSNIFDNYSGLFLGQSCSLVFEDPRDGDGKRYLPKINGKVRHNEDELSESQRFFVDQAFRMSLISLLNEGTSFFMCETPDSSLDISYEQNAAKIFLKYIENPNTLILTSNLNNSEFLEYIVKNAPRISYLNLLKMGRQSDIQAASAQLISASNKIERQIDG